MENHFVRRFPRLLPSSFTSCQFRHVPDTVDTSIATTKSTQILRKNEGSPFSRTHSNSSLSKPQKSKTIKNEPKVYEAHDRSFSLGSDQRKEMRSAQVLKLNTSSSSNGGWFSSEDGLVDGQTNTFFSFSSGSSESFRMKISQNHKVTDVCRCSSEISLSSISNPKTYQKNAKTSSKPEMDFHGVDQEGYDEIPGIPAELYYNGYNQRSCRRKTTKSGRKTGKKSRRRRRGALNAGEVAGSCSVVVDGRVEDSYAVEKTSSDPHSDFRVSMVEMIVEKQIFGAEDLERLLSCFLSLNSPCYHKVIFEVFLEICGTLFTN